MEASKNRQGREQDGMAERFKEQALKSTQQEDRAVRDRAGKGPLKGG